MKILSFNEHSTLAPDAGVICMANDADPRETSLWGVKRIDLHFPTVTDDRAYSQAVLLRRGLGFEGEFRATSHVFID